MSKLYGVIGDPIAHSMSPLMHNDLFQFYGINAHYFPFHVTKESLEDAVKGFKAIGISGFNVTVPHKVAIMEYLDEIDPLAKAIGAVNTVVNVDGKLIGFNTDGNGFVRGLKAHISDLTVKKVLMIGSGGAARAIYFSLASAGVKKLDFYNRTKENAQKLIDECPFAVESTVFDKAEAEARLGEYDVIIQTTSIGMSPYTDATPLNVGNLKQGAFVSDIIYNPWETRILALAKGLGATVQNGLDMFVYQGALAFELWTGQFPDTDRMKEIVSNQLGGKTC